MRKRVREGWEGEKATEQKIYEATNWNRWALFVSQLEQIVNVEKKL